MEDGNGMCVCVIFQIIAIVPKVATVAISSRLALSIAIDSNCDRSNEGTSVAAATVVVGILLVLLVLANS